MNKWKLRFDASRVKHIPMASNSNLTKEKAINLALRLLSGFYCKEVAIIQPDSSIFGWFRSNNDGSSFASAQIIFSSI